MKAKALADQLVREMGRCGAYVKMPNLEGEAGRAWVGRWRKDHGVCWRKPNRRIKGSKAVLGLRLKYMWGNNIRVRKAAVMLLGHDLFIDGIDEKGIHYNESGSKCTRTLDIIGAPAVTLKQNHADTRKRVTIMTCVSNDERAAKRRRKLPLEMLFQSKTAKTKSKVLRKAKLPKDLDMSATVGPKGSYREEHVVVFLER